MFGYLARHREVGRLESFSAPFVYSSFLYFNVFAPKFHTNLYVTYRLTELKTDYVVILFVNIGSRTCKVFTFNLKIQPYLCNFYARKNYFHLEILHEYQLNRMLNHAYEEWSSFFFQFILEIEPIKKKMCNGIRLGPIFSSWDGRYGMRKRHMLLCFQEKSSCMNSFIKILHAKQF